MRSTASHGLSGPTQCRGIPSYFRDRRSFRIWTDVEVSSVTPITAPPSSERGRSEKRRTLRAGPEVAMPQGRGATLPSRLRESTSERGPASSVPAAMARPRARGVSGARSTPRGWGKNGAPGRAGEEPRVADLVGERDEGQEASRAVLLFSQAQEVLHALGQGLDVAVEHRGVGADPQRVGDAVDLAPPVGVRLAGVPELLLQPAGEDLRAASGHRVKPRRLEADQGLPRAGRPPPPKVIDLRGGEGLDLYVGMLGVDGADQALVVLEGPVWVVAPADVHLPDAVLDHSQDVFDRVLEGAGLSLLPGEVAEAAGQDAQVGGIDVAVDDEEDPVADAPPLCEVGHLPDAQEVVGLEEKEAVLPGEPLARGDFLPNREEAGVPQAWRGCKFHRTDQSVCMLGRSGPLCQMAPQPHSFETPVRS